MNIWMIVLAIAVISVVLAFASLKDLSGKSHFDSVKKKLSKNRIIFQDSSSRR